jgi:hypothetical protein
MNKSTHQKGRLPSRRERFLLTTAQVIDIEISTGRGVQVTDVI